MKQILQSMFGIDLWSNIYESIFEEILLGINLPVKQAFESSLWNRSFKHFWNHWSLKQFCNQSVLESVFEANSLWINLGRNPLMKQSLKQSLNMHSSDHALLLRRLDPLERSRLNQSVLESIFEAIVDEPIFEEIRCWSNRWSNLWI